MSLTRSHFLTEPVIRPDSDLKTFSGSGLIVAHGSPSDPDALNEGLRHLGTRVQNYVPHWHIQTATLAKPGSLNAAVRLLNPREKITVYPLFMSDGWFVKEELPRRMKLLTTGAVRYLPALGLDPDLPDRCFQRALLAANNLGYAVKDCSLILAAHGSPNTSKPRQAAMRIQDEILKKDAFYSVRLGYVEERPSIAEVSGGANPAICLPLFATRAGHVRFDIPQALSTGGFSGKVLPPICEDPETPSLIAKALVESSLRKK